MKDRKLSQCTLPSVSGKSTQQRRDVGVHMPNDGLSIINLQNPRSLVLSAPNLAQVH